MLKLREKAFIVIRKELLELQRNLSFNVTINHLSSEFQKRYAYLYNELKEQRGSFKLLYKNEVFKQYLEFVLAKNTDIGQSEQIQ